MCCSLSIRIRITWIEGSPYSTTRCVVVEHVVPVPPEDEGLCLRHLTDGAAKLYRAPSFVELLADICAPLIYYLNNWSCAIDKDTQILLVIVID